MDRIELPSSLKETSARISRGIVFIIFVFMISFNYECEAGKRYKIVILPFKDNTRMNLGEMIPDVLRSTVTQTGYFEAVDRNKIYEAVIEVLPSDLIKIDNTKREGGAFTAEQIDLFARLDMKRVQKFSKRLKADYAVRGAASQFADSLRIDAEIISVKNNKSLGFVSVEGVPEELLTKMLNELSGEITKFCRSLNAYDDALGIMGMYNQGQYTFNVTEKKLKELLSITRDTIGIHAVLMTLYFSEIRSAENTMLHRGGESPPQGGAYSGGSRGESRGSRGESPPQGGAYSGGSSHQSLLGRGTLEYKIIEEGERILYLLNQNYDEKVLEIFLSSGFDPFDEIAKIYSKRGANDKAIEVYQKAIRVYPMNIAGHYKGLGMLYLKEGLEDKAIQAFTKSLDENKASYELHFILASIFEKRYQPEEAGKHLEECIKYARSVEEVKIAKEKIDELALSSR
ncbi:MAG: tetratricopeptide repeat protein [Candidatus Scalindua sediminis]|nr:tetratricopeptide repeat protein [Candidatus Scalindua sediminis]